MNPFFSLTTLSDVLDEEDGPYQPIFGLDNRNFNQDSPYITLNETNKFHNPTGHFSIVNVNARSISKHFIELVALLKNTKADCLVVTETWLSKNNMEFWNFQGYKSYHHPRIHATHGGVSIFIRDSIHSEELASLTITNELIECKGISVQLGNYKLNILGIYTSPSSSRPLFLNSLENLLTLLDNEEDTILTGDFNLNLLKIKEDANCFRLYNTLISQSYHPLITRATHPNIIINNSSLLDQTWFRSNKSAQSAIIMNKISDHFPSIVQFQFNSPNGTQIKICSRPCNPEKLNKFTELIQNTNFNFVKDQSLSSNLKFNKFNEIITEHYFSSFPLITKTLSKKRLDNPWLTDALLKSINQKDNLYKLSKSGIIPDTLFKSYRNRLNKVLQQSKDNYYKDKFSENSSPRTQWNLINEVLNKSKKRDGYPTNLKVNDTIITNPQEIINQMNSFFSKVGTVTASTIPPSATSFENYLTDNHPNDF